MEPFNVDQQGATVDRLDNELVVIRGSRILDRQVLNQIQQVIIAGNIRLTPAARAILAYKHIDVVFLTSYNRYQGRLGYNEAKLAGLRHLQLQHLSNPQRCLTIARAIVIGKLNNQRTLLQRQQGKLPNHKAEQNIYKAIAGIAQMIKGAQQTNNLDSLRGFEGKGAAYYFGAWRLLVPQGFTFTGRAYHPPPDPVNALLSFGYALLTKDVTTAIQLIGLDPYIGFFHAIQDGRPSLALDLMEEFRVIIVDRMVLTLLNRKKITPADFTWTNNPKRPVQLNNQARQIVLQAYKKQLDTTITHPLAKRQMSYRETINWQAQRLAHLIQGKTPTYQAVIIK